MTPVATGFTVKRRTRLDPRAYEYEPPSPPSARRPLSPPQRF